MQTSRSKTRRWTFLMPSMVMISALAYRPALSQAALPQLPSLDIQPGQWEVSSTLQGAPVGGGTDVRKFCLSQGQLSTPEQTLVNAVARKDNSSTGGPRCTLSNLNRDGNKSLWNSSCESPRGLLTGSGEATWERETANASQTFQLKTSMGAFTLTQTLRARRLGECP